MRWHSEFLMSQRSLLCSCALTSGTQVKASFILAEIPLDRLDLGRSLERDQALSLWSVSTDTKTLGNQRTNPRECQTVRTHTKETTWIQDPNTSNTLCRTPHPSNKQNTNTNPIISSQDYHLTQPHSSEKNKQTKLSTNLTLHEAHTNHWTKLSRAETKRKKEFNLEPWEKKT